MCAVRLRYALNVTSNVKLLENQIKKHLTQIIENERKQSFVCNHSLCLVLRETISVNQCDVAIPAQINSCENGIFKSPSACNPHEMTALRGRDIHRVCD